MTSIHGSDWSVRNGGAAIFRDVLLGVRSSNISFTRSTFVFGQTGGGALPSAARLAGLAPAMLVDRSNISAASSALLTQSAGEVFFRDCGVRLQDTTWTIRDSTVVFFDSQLFLRNARVVLVNSNLWLYNTPVSGDSAVTGGPVQSLSRSAVMMEAGVSATVRLSGHSR
jgi:hypothetical protein